MKEKGCESMTVPDDSYYEGVLGCDWLLQGGQYWDESCNIISRLIGVLCMSGCKN